MGGVAVPEYVEVPHIVGKVIGNVVGMQMGAAAWRVGWLRSGC